ncbi:MAG: hypothetical protein HOF01_10955 [Chloroflexi bacterium]|jgi:hypothetical protein|nr:hypothetical protein [Chloroflexota bacterium]
MINSSRLCECGRGMKTGEPSRDSDYDEFAPLSDPAGIRNLNDVMWWCPRDGKTQPLTDDEAEQLSQFI